MNNHGIIERCRKAMYDAIWKEIDRDPQQAAMARVDVKFPSGDISIYCDRFGNVACVTHTVGNNESETLEEAIEECISYDSVMDDYLAANPESVSQEDELMSHWNTRRLDALMLEMY